MRWYFLLNGVLLLGFALVFFYNRMVGLGAQASIIAGLALIASAALTERR